MICRQLHSTSILAPSISPGRSCKLVAVALHTSSSVTTVSSPQPAGWPTPPAVPSSASNSNVTDQSVASSFADVGHVHLRAWNHDIEASSEKDKTKEPGAAVPKAAPKTTKQNTTIVVNFISLSKEKALVQNQVDYCCLVMANGCFIVGRLQTNTKHWYSCSLPKKKQNSIVFHD